MILHYKMRTIRRATALILTVLLAALQLSAAAESVISKHKAIVYRSLDPNSAAAVIPAGTIMELTNQGDGWVQVTRKGITAYMRSSDVDLIVDCNSTTAYTSQAAPMYKAYGKSAKYGTIPAGTAVTVYAIAGDWACVGCNGHRGLVAKSALTTQQPETPTTPTAQMTVYVAKNGARAYKSHSTSSKVLCKLPMNTPLSLIAVRGSWAFVSGSGKYAYMRTSDLSKTEITAPAEPEEKPAASRGIQAMDWWTSDIQSIFARGVTATITDVATGISWNEIRKGGTNHADCQPLTAQDTANLKKACGGKWSWNRRAVVVTINGQHYAASINCMPHGGGSVTGNNFNGHHCVHFINSRTSGTNKVDADHQAAIKKALALNSK